MRTAPWPTPTKNTNTNTPQQNLATSPDTEKEEMLTVPRQKVQHRIQYAKDGGEENADYYNGYAQAIYDLFGAKCLPDDVDSLSQNPPENCDNENLISTDDNKPVEPKFKYSIGQKVKSAYADEVLTIKEHCGRVGNDNVYKVEEYAYTWNECELLPYTEPKKDKAEEIAEKAIEPVEKHFDNILKDRFRNERRLNIAAMAMQGILANPDEVHRAGICSTAKETPKAIAEYALALADALIAECEEGDTK